MKFTFLFLFVLVSALTNGQVGIGTTAPNAHSVLDLRSPGNNQGLLVPVLTTAQRTPLGSSLSATDIGLLVFDSNDKTFYFWNGAQWDPVQHGAASAGGTVTNVATGTGLTGGPITSSGTLSLANTAVVPGVYGSATQVGQFVVDAQGRITFAGNSTIAGVPPGGAAGGDLTGTYPNPTIGTGKVTSTSVLDGTLVNVDISGVAAIVDGKLATISTPGKVLGDAITSGTIGGSTAMNTTGTITTTNKIVSSGNLAGNLITATNTFTGGTAVSGTTSSTNAGYGVFGQGNGVTVGRSFTFSWGVYGNNIYSGAYGGLGSLDGVYGNNVNGNGVKGDGYYGVFGTGSYIGVIGVAGPGATYGIYSSGQAAGTTTWAAVSDARFKKNLKPIDHPLDKILSMRGVRYDWRSDEFPTKHFSTRPDIGVIAQEIKPVLPEAVIEDKDGYYSVSYEKIVPVLIEAMKEQQARIGTLEKAAEELAALKARLASLEALLQPADPQTLTGRINEK